MSTTFILFSILGTLMIGAVSPGPSFIMVSRVAISRSRLDGLAAAVGMGLGGVLFSMLALAGLAAVLIHLTWLYIVFKIAGSIYLFHLAFQIWKGAKSPVGEIVANRSRSSIFQSFQGALLTQLSNPKAIIFYGSIFAAFLPQNVPVELAVLLPVGVFAVEAGWYTVVALAFSSERPKRVYLRAKHYIDRVTSALLGMLGIRLIFSAIE